MQIGIDSFVINTPDPATNQGLDTAERIRNLLAEIECADKAGVDSFGIGEHHRHSSRGCGGADESYPPDQCGHGAQCG